MRACVWMCVCVRSYIFYFGYLSHKELCKISWPSCISQASKTTNICKYHGSCLGSIEWMEGKNFITSWQGDPFKSSHPSDSHLLHGHFQLPKSLCRDLSALMNKFYWGHKDNDTKMIWMGWDHMRLSKQISGMGFRDLESFNLAMLVKQGWKILQHPESLMA